MQNINNFLNTLDVFYCESFEPIDYGYGAGYGGAYAGLANTFKGNGLIGTDRYGNGKGDILKCGFGEGNANYSHHDVPNMFYNYKIEDKGYGSPYIKN